MSLYGTVAGGIRERAPGDGKKAFRSGGNVWTWLTLFILPHTLFSLMLFSIVFCLYTKSWQLYFAAAISVLIPLDYGIKGWTAEPEDEREYKRVRYNRFYAIVTAAGALFGVLFGYVLYDRAMHQYLAVQMGAKYTNVVPTSRAAEFADATILTFDSTTRVDTGRSVGYVSKAAGAGQYCAAPVMGPAGIGHSDVQFWSIGTECCGHRGGFECGSLISADTTDGKNCLVEVSADPDFHEAISLASAENGLHSADNAMLCRFVADIPGDLQRQLNVVYGGLFASEVIASLVGYFVARTYASKFA